MLGFGAAKLFYPRLRVIARLPWIILFIVSGACLLQLQTRYFFDWKKLNIQGPGGSIGYFFGKKLLLTAMGDVFESQLQGSLKAISKDYADKVKVDPTNQFVGLDAYEKVLNSGIDVAILATPPGFRPQHLAASPAGRAGRRTVSGRERLS